MLIQTLCRTKTLVQVVLHKFKPLGKNTIVKINAINHHGILLVKNNSHGW